MSDEGVTNGELYRLILEMKKETGLALSGIYTEQKLTNGRVRRAEVAIAMLQVGYALGAFVLGGLFLWAVNKLGS